MLVVLVEEDVRYVRGVYAIFKPYRRHILYDIRSLAHFVDKNLVRKIGAYGIAARTNKEVNRYTILLVSLELRR